MKLNKLNLEQGKVGHTWFIVEYKTQQYKLEIKSQESYNTWQPHVIMFLLTNTYPWSFKNIDKNVCRRRDLSNTNMTKMHTIETCLLKLTIKKLLVFNNQENPQLCVFCVNICNVVHHACKYNLPPQTKLIFFMMVIARTSVELLEMIQEQVSIIEILMEKVH